MNSIGNLYKQAKSALAFAGIPEAEAEAKEIIRFLSGKSASDIILHPEININGDISEILQKRISGMPLAYVLSNKNFMGYDFYVDKNVLIPRYDTEILVFEAIKTIKSNNYKSVLDMCCGSGCIGIVIEKETGAFVTGADICPEAVEISAKNAKKNHAANYKSVLSDLFSNIFDVYDIIVSNPPYVTEDEYACLDPQVRDFEPKLALLGALRFYKKIAARAKAHLKDGGHLLFEIGWKQKDAIFDILKENNYNNIECCPDLAGRDRVIICTKN